MSRYRYSWSKHYAVEATVVGEIVRKAKTAERLLEVASDPKSPIHGQFEWDDSRAAKQYRLVQARVMIASLNVEVINKSGKSQSVTAFVKVSDRGGHYVPTMEADEDDLSSAEAECLQQMSAFKSKWKGLEFARDVIDSIKLIERSISRRGQRAA
jgi:hypothetical protein